MAISWNWKHLFGSKEKTELSTTDTNVANPDNGVPTETNSPTEAALSMVNGSTNTQDNPNTSVPIMQNNPLVSDLLGSKLGSNLSPNNIMENVLQNPKIPDSVKQMGASLM
jgi:hypothetical protein